MKKNPYYLFLFFFLISANAWSQCSDYRRSSIYSILVCHPELEFGKDIDTVFRQMPLPDKFDDHNLKIRSIRVTPKIDKKSKSDPVKPALDDFLVNNEIAKRLVAKWFNRKTGRGQDGTYDTELIVTRGLYDADYFDTEFANMSVRGQSLLADAGEDLIGNTYVILNDIKYVDKEETSSLVSAGIYILGTMASEFTGGLANTLVSAATNVSMQISSKIAGFRVRIPVFPQ